MQKRISWSDNQYWIKRFPIYENGIYIELAVTRKEQIKLLHFSSKPFLEEDLPWYKGFEEGFQLVQIDLAGFDRPYERHGNKYVVTAPGCMLKFVGLTDDRNADGRLLTITQKDETSHTTVESYMQFYDGIPVVRMWNTVKNVGEQEQTLTYISSFSYTGIEKEGKGSADDKLELYIPHNGWQKELNWRKYKFGELGFQKTQNRIWERTSKTIEVYNTGNWSTKQYLPMGYLRNIEAGTGLIWQIEHNGSWQYEIADQNGHFLCNVSGPTENQSHWSKNLKPEESFTTVPVAIGAVDASINHAFDALVAYRRRIRRQNTDNKELPVIFNDYMNCLWGNPTTATELPLIDAAAKAGCEYFVIDAGWYAKGEWWDSVGAWEESRERFPNGLREVTDYIRSKNMIPGIWLEIEVMGINSPKVREMPGEAFFMRHGKKIYDRSRFQLDFRHPAVVKHATDVIDRLIKEYGIGYIKMDYNIEPGIGTEIDADSFGDGLLSHERAYINWLDNILTKYPELVIENCSSGGLRMDYALLSRCSLQSTSDQEEYDQYAQIAVNAPTGVNPEQAAIWSYPLETGDQEEVIFNMVNAILLRIHQSGHLAKLSEDRFNLIAEGIFCYKNIRKDLATALPYWPLGLAMCEDSWLCLGMKAGDKRYLAVWRTGGDESSISFCPFPEEDMDQDVSVEITQIYPMQYDKEETYQFNREEKMLTVHFKNHKMARLYEIKK